MKPDRSTLTVSLAALANLVIGVAKLVAGLVSGSVAMLAEAAHSGADTVNQALLLTAVRRSVRPADEEHPFGYGKERYVWALLAAVSTLVLGAGFALVRGVQAVLAPSPLGSLRLAAVVLAVTFAMESVSLVRAGWQLRRDAAEHGTTMWGWIRHGDEPTARAVLLEDSAALAGVLLAGLGLAIGGATGDARWDAAASVLIGLLLVAVALALGRQNVQLLVGRSVGPDAESAIATVIATTTGVERIVRIQTMHLGPDDVLVAAQVGVAPTLTGEELEALADVVDRRIREQAPQVRHVFLDPTPAAPRSDAWSGVHRVPGRYD